MQKIQILKFLKVPAIYEIWEYAFKVNPGVERWLYSIISGYKTFLGL